MPADGKAQVSLFATGSEVSIAVEARKLLSERGVLARVVSVPCFELLLEAPDAVRRAAIGDAPVKVAVEAGVRQGWDRDRRRRRRICGHGCLRRQRAVQGPVQDFGITRAGGRAGGIEKALRKRYNKRQRHRPRKRAIQ